MVIRAPLSVAARFTLGLLVPSVIGMASVVTVVAHAVKSRTEDAAISQAMDAAHAVGNRIRVGYEEVMAVTRTLRDEVVALREIDQLSRDGMTALMRKTLDGNPAIVGVWAGWEPNALDGRDSANVGSPAGDSAGRYAKYIVRHPDGVRDEPLEGYEGETPLDYYGLPKREKRESVVEPYGYFADGNWLMLTTFSEPILVNDRFLGAVGSDMALNAMQTILAESHPLETGRVSLISDMGLWLSDAQTDHIGKPVEASDPSLAGIVRPAIAGAISVQHANSTWKNEGDVLRVFVPLALGRSQTSWLLVVTIPSATVFAQTREVVGIIAGAGLMLVLIVCGIVIWTTRAAIGRPLRLITDRLREHDGVAPFSRDYLRLLSRQDEIGGMARAVQQAKESAARLSAKDAEVREANKRSEAALGNMSQGLCLFDAEGHLQVYNEQLCELYGLRIDELRPGLSVREIYGRCLEAGNFPGSSLEEALAEQQTLIERREPGLIVQKLRMRRIASVVHRPMPDGGWVATYEDVTDRRAADERIAHMARHDGLTGLPNKIVLHERLERALADAGRDKLSALLFVDLDHFNHVNDTLGHVVGDGLLRAASDRLLACVAEGDSVVRLGGDEFAIVQAAIGRPENATLLAETIIADLASPFMIDGHSISIGGSIGLALIPHDGADVTTLLKHADIALYRAKAEGRSTYRFFEAGMDSRLKKLRQTEIDLRRALATDEFELFYQPLVNLATEEVSGFEALVRWRHPERGMVSPAEFIPIAEETGLIIPLGEKLIRMGCAEAASWPEHIKVAINLSPVQFRSKNLVQTVTDALAATGLAPHRLELEVTESLLLQDDDRTMQMLHRFREAGIRISLDDFGTGYSSLSYLRSFPFDKIKIDQSFIRDLSHRAEAIHIVRAIKGLSSGLGMTTTAEGVETEEQYFKLVAEGCTEVQGYLFSPPKPANDVLTIIADVNAMQRKCTRRSSDSGSRSARVPSD